MGFYVRKGFSLGPFRLNLSRSGLGVSLGVKGARIGIGPRGSYIHVGRGGLYYRQSFDGAPRPRRVISPSAAPLEEIDSTDVDGMVDSSSAALLQELTRVHTRTLVFPVALVLVVLLAGALGLAPMLLAAQTFPSVAQTPVEVPVADVLREKLSVGTSRARLPVVWWALAIAAVLAGIPILLRVRRLDIERGSTRLNYELEPEAEQRFARLVQAFENLSTCDRAWHVSAQGCTGDWKRNAGATTIVTRTVIRPTFGKPPRVACAIEVPVLPAGSETLYFFPDRILVYTRGRVGAVSYPDLDVSMSDVAFREDGDVPSDACIAGTTWRFVAKSGGPDRRFRDNREIPIVRYGQFRFRSRSGLDELFQCSQWSVPAAISSALRGQAGEARSGDQTPAN